SNGGGLFNFTQGTLTVLRSTVVGNFSKLEGGGIRNVGNTADALRVLNSTIAFNNSDGGSGGGGISTVNGTVRVVNTTVYGNSDTSNNAGGAGGIDRSGGTLVLANSIVALNFAAPATTQENVDPAEINTDTDNFLGGDPRLGPLRDNGGPTFTLAPLPGSPVIDAGTNAAATDTGAAGGTPLATDQRGASRVFDGDSDGTATVDQGAVEFTLSPVIAFPGGALAVAEGDPAAVLDPGATVTVPSGVGLGGGNLTVEITAGATSADLLGVRNEGTGAGQIGVSNTSITFGGVAIGTFAGGTGGTLLVITFNASATPEAVQALLRNITFDTTALAASTAPRTVRAVLTAAGGIASNAAQKTVNVTPAPVTVTVNQAAGQADPTNAQPVLFTVVFSEPVSGFDASDVTVGGTATGGTAAVAESGPMDGTTYTVSVSGLTSAGTVTVSVPAGAAVDTAGNPSEASTSTDNTVTFQTSPPVPPVPPPPPPPVGQNSTDRFGVGLGIGGGGAVTVHTGDGGAAFAIDAFAPAPPGGVRVAVADVTGDGVADVIAGAGPGALPQVKVFDGATQALLITIDAFEPSFLGGVYVAAGDLDGDGKADVVITPDEGGGPRVRVFRGGDFAQLNDFFGIEDLAFRGGARAALADVSGDGRIDLLVAAGFGGGPRIAVFDGVSVATGSTTPEKLVPDFFVFETTLRNGVFIAGGDITGDGFAEVIAGGGPGGGPRVFALSGRELVESGAQVAAANFFAGDVANRGGIRIVAKDFDGDGRADLVAGAGTDAPPLVTRYSGVNIPAEGTPPELDSFFAGPPNFLGGVFVG
ncbi:MAG TPA: VCBS repeat-containing protein, partial [Gemmataceae bacterium]